MLIKHVLSHFTKFVKTRFLAQKSGSRLRCRTMLKETPTKHALRLFEKFLKIRFSAQKCGSRLRCRTVLKYLETHQLNMFWGFLRNFWNSGSRPRCRTMIKILWNTQKTATKHALRHFKNFLKIRFLAEKSGSRLRCRIILKYHETLRKHRLNTFWGLLRNSWKSGSRLKNPVLGSDFELC